jgi:hypothetical protein
MTSFENKCSILAELWMDYRDDEEFVDFREYNDLGLPIAYALANNIVSKQPMAEQFVEETFDLLLTALEIPEDTGFESLDDLLGSSL